MVELLENEITLAAVSGGRYEVVLTPWRVVARGESLGADTEQIIPLECVDSIFIGTSRHSMLLLLGVALGLGGLLARSLFVLALAAGVLALWWFLAKRGAHIISRSGKTTITLVASGGASERQAITRFVVELQGAMRVRRA